MGSMRQVQKAFVLTLLIVIAAASACGKEEPRRPQRSLPARADFKAGEVRAINPSERPEAQQKAAEEAPKVLALLNDFYSTAFLDSKKWSGGTHSELANLFTAEARPHIGAHLGALALADLAPQVKGLDPAEQNAPRITFFVEDDLSVPVGVVNATFQAKATPVRGKTPLAVSHTASFWVVKEGEAYRIYAYSTELKADSQAKSAAFGVPPRGSLR